MRKRLCRLSREDQYSQRDRAVLVWSHQLALGTAGPIAEEQCPGHRRLGFVWGHSTGLLGKYWVGTDWRGGQSKRAKPWSPGAQAG